MRFFIEESQVKLIEFYLVSNESIISLAFLRIGSSLDAINLPSLEVALNSYSLTASSYVSFKVSRWNFSISYSVKCF